MKQSFDSKQYQKKSQNEINLSDDEIIKHGATTYPPYLRSPYNFFEIFIKNNLKRNSRVVDVCCGNGKHSIISAKCGGDVLGVDIVKSSIDIAKKKAELNGVSSNTSFIVSDVLSLPLENNSVDVITCLGSLSYLDCDKFLDEAERILKIDGILIIVDSLDKNIIYKLNRLIQVLSFRRSLSTFRRMPNQKTLNKIESKFPNTSFYYFNLFVWIAPILKPFISPIKLKRIIDYLDKRFIFFTSFAFKFSSISTKK